MVTSLHDGMNLVAKEFVFTRDGDGVLSLSRFTGAASGTAGRTPRNPYDVDGMAEAVRTALEMPKDERRTRMVRMCGLLTEGQAVAGVCTAKATAKLVILSVRRGVVPVVFRKVASNRPSPDRHQDCGHPGEAVTEGPGPRIGARGHGRRSHGVLDAKTGIFDSFECAISEPAFDLCPLRMPGDRPWRGGERADLLLHGLGS